VEEAVAGKVLLDGNQVGMVKVVAVVKQQLRKRKEYTHRINHGNTNFRTV
jgi:hypothetical protein